MTRQPEDPRDVPQAETGEAPLSDALRRVAEEGRLSWPDDTYVPHEKARGRHAVADSIVGGAIMQGGAGRI